MTYNLFALTGISGRRVLRLPLSQDVQLEVTEAFKLQEAGFEAAAQETIQFDGKYKVDEGECLSIDDFNDLDDLDNAILNPLSIPEIDPTPVEFASIKALFSGYKPSDGICVALVQYFDRRRVISAQGLSLFHSANVYRKVDGVGITLGGELTAVLKGTTLRFFNFAVARRIFDLTAHFNDATDGDLTKFAELPTISVPAPDLFLAQADSVVRRQVAILTGSQVLETVPIQTVVKAAEAFKIKIDTVDVNGQEAIIIPSNKTELKKLLRFLNEDYHTSLLLSEPYLSNSKRRVT